MDSSALINLKAQGLAGAAVTNRRPSEARDSPSAWTFSRASHTRTSSPRTPRSGQPEQHRLTELTNHYDKNLNAYYSVSYQWRHTRPTQRATDRLRGRLIAHTTGQGVERSTPCCVLAIVKFR